MEQQQKRPSLHFTAEAGAGAGTGAGSGAETGSNCSPATTPLGSNGNAGFLPDMPQWKKDLIQRRKTNVARTNAAASSPTTSTADGSSTASSQSTQGKDATAAFLAETPISTTTTAPIPKQRSSLFNTRSQSTGKEQQQHEEILNLDATVGEREREQDSERERERACGERDDVEVNMLNSSSHHSSSNRVLRSRSNASGEVETSTATTGALTALGSGGSAVTATTATSSSSANQLQTKCKLGQSVGAEAAATATTVIVDKNCKTKISDKLQSNKFIQNQQQQQQQQQLAASPTKVAVKTTMVAMQEMKKTTTQNGQHRHHHHHHHHNVKNANAAATAAVDVAAGVEDLSYGPGIVSKLRCRYLSLALRCEATRQQSQQQSQRLQRSTSLNTLLDRSDNDNDDDDVEEEELEVSKQCKAVAASAAVAPPIVGVKPTGIATTGSGYIKSVGFSVAQQRQQQHQQQQQQQQQQQLEEQQQRSRHFKRGNEVMKRARSVEALLCEKSPWNTQRAMPAATNINNVNNNNAVVTIEDKISNARERLHSGSDAAPPKRLSSIIDDTERPPPDLVKQTLKMFEASVNRRPRSAQRSNGVGGVASKVANYKSIIKEQKTSSSPGVALAASTPKQRPTTANNVPDIIPRQLEANYETPPISKVLARKQLATPTQQQQQQQTEVGSPASVVGGVGGGGGVEIGGAKQQQRLVSGDHSDNDNNDDADADENNEDKVNDDDVADAAEGAGDDDEKAHDNAENVDEVCNGDKLGAAGDKLTAAATATAAQSLEETSTAAAGGGSSVQRLQENVTHVTTSNSNRKLPQRSSGSSENNDSSCGLSINSTQQVTKQIGVIRPLLNQASSSSSSSTVAPPLTSREIEKNRINEMKKSNALAADAAAAAALAAGGNASLDNVINTNKDASETDTAAAAASPIWPHLRKRRQPNTGAGVVGGAGGAGLVGGSSHGNSLTDNNTSMVFNFSKSSKEVPDYIESDVVIYRRKRELPKPNEPGFVLLGDLSVETSTDTDYDDYSMCPPSPCDVEFENANIVIDGKSSIRQKAKDSSFRVQFNDTLTSTFEYPSEASQIIDDPPYADPYGGNVNKHHQLFYDEQLVLQQQQQQQQQQHHHHVTVDEIIELPTSTTTTTTTTPSTSSTKTSATSAMLGNLPLDYPSLGRGIILPELETEPEILPASPRPLAAAVSSSISSNSKPSSRRRASVLLKPQYACFLHNDAVQPSPPSLPSLPSSHPARKAASFCGKQQSKYATPQNTSSSSSSSKRSGSSSSSSSSSYFPLLASRRTSLPTNSTISTSLALPNATTALLQARIPGNTLYYV
ncbi:hypothetical protein KR093_005904 [Drosophila rubida]|uniref:Uncharacterized protein n=1 Tax=Drosophila rubida TaxID=30044 RepID=A0AAD4KA85_9MUSC|nr:hypothetical protein KR093_005904 [Drosophila rubida]